jgi:2-keto-4-pentenoate hydratase
MTDSLENLAKALIAAHDGGPLVGAVDEALVPADMTAVGVLQDAIIAGIGPTGGWKILAGAEGDPICSPVPANRYFADGATIDATHHRFIITEVEVAVLLGRDLFGSVTTSDVEAAIASVHPVLEMVGNPFVDRDATPRNVQLGDLQSNGAVISGPAVSEDIKAHLQNLTVTLTYDGKVIKEVSSGASWADIVAALVWLAPRADARGLPLRAGNTVITGARIAVPLEKPAVIEGSFGQWGKVTGRFTY